MLPSTPGIRTACALAMAGVFVAVGSCSLEGLTGGPGMPLVVNAGDASTSLDAWSGPSLIDNGGFEISGVGCSPWASNVGTTSRSPAGHAGSAHACRVCATSAVAKLSLYGPSLSMPKPGAYRLSGWVRIASGAPSSTFRLYADYGTDAGWSADIRSSAAATTEWLRLEAEGVIPAGTEWTKFYVDLNAVEKGTCFDFDDVVFEKAGE